MKDIQESFAKWFRPKKPKSYTNWDERLDEIKEAYFASFGNNVFEIDTDNIDLSINEIKSNMEKRDSISDTTFAVFNKKMSNGIPQAILNKWLILFLENYQYLLDNDYIVNKTNDDIDKIEVKNNFRYENDLQNSLISQVEELFPDYKIYGEKGEGIEYSIGGRRIDLLLEHKNKNDLLALELKAGIADFKVFGQISMYLGLLMEEFGDRKINGIIIAGEINDSLIKAALTNKNIKLMKYKMELLLNGVE
jgi:hypothetical protein